MGPLFLLARHTFTLYVVVHVVGIFFRFGLPSPFPDLNASMTATLPSDPHSQLSFLYPVNDMV